MFVSELHVIVDEIIIAGRLQRSANVVVSDLRRHEIRVQSKRRRRVIGAAEDRDVDRTRLWFFLYGGGSGIRGVGDSSGGGGGG